MATSQTCLDIGDLDYILCLLEKCCFPETKWYKFGLRLGLKKNTLDVIEAKHHSDVPRCMTECLSQWLGRADNVDSRGGANLYSLSDALRSMNETAVAEKLKHHVLINIFNNRHTVLSQSLCDSVSIARLLYGECMLTQEAVSRVVSASPSIPNQHEALLTAVKEAVQTDPNSLHTFANVLCTISTNVSLGQTILDDISKYFPTPEVHVVPETKPHDLLVVPQNSTTTDKTKIPTHTQSDSSSDAASQPLSPQVEIHVPVSEGLLGGFRSMIMSYGKMFYNVGKIIKRISPPLEEIKEFLSCCGAILRRKVEQCTNIPSVLRLIQDECSLTDIELLHSVVEQMEITEATRYIEAYRTELKEFCKSLSLSLCLKERFASISHLQCETVTFIFDWKPEEHLLKDIMELLAKVSGKLLKITYIERSKSITVTCSFPFSDVGFTVLRMIENIHILMRQGLKKLTIGNLTLWRRQDVRQKELKEKDQDLPLQHTDVISYIILEEAEYKLRDAISSKEKEAIELKQEISMAQEESLSVQNDTEPIKAVEEEDPLHEELTVLSSQFNEIKEENKELSDKLLKMKVEYLRLLSLSSNTDSAASKVRRGMAFEIDGCKFQLEAMARPDYQPLVDKKRIIEKLQERITLMNMELMTKREHNEKIIKDVKVLKKTEEKTKRQRKKEKQIEEEMCLIILYCNHPVTGELNSSFLEVHKDELLPTVLDKAYETAELAPHTPIERCRLVKYNYERHEMEQSLDLNEFQHLTIGQIMDVVKCYSLFLETCKENETFKKYNTETIRVSVVALSSGVVGPPKAMRVWLGWTVENLKQHIGEAYNLNSSCMRVVMEEKDYWSDTSFSDISGVGGTLKKILNMRGHNTSHTQLLYVSSDPEDYQKGFRESLMYTFIEFHFNSILLDITIPPGPKASTPTTTNRRKGRITMKIISMEEENKEKERKIQVQVDKRITLAELKEELVPLIGVPPTGFRVCGINGYEVYELERLDENKILMNLSESKLIVKLGRPLRIGEYRIKLYLLQVNSIEFLKFMMESIVAEDTPVREFKRQIIEEAKVQGIDCVLELDKMRLRKKNGVSPGWVYLDELIDTSSIREMYVESLKGPEKKMDYGQRQVYVIRWRPSQCSVDPIEEIILDKYHFPRDFIKKLSELSGVPTEYISYSEGKSFPVGISCLDIENKLKWYSITSDSPYSSGLYNDGYVIYYKDNREKMKELTDKERSEIQEAEEKRQRKKKEEIEKDMCLIILYCNHPVTGKLKKSFLEVHKDELLPTVLDKAYELMKLAPHIPIERCRLVKYDYECHEMEQSLDCDEFQHLTIGQIMDLVGCYSLFLFLETRKENEIFEKYNSGSIILNLRVSVVDLSSGVIGPPQEMIARLVWTVENLKQHIGEVYNLNSSCMRLVMREKDYWSDTSISDTGISDVGGILKKILNTRGHSTSHTQLLYVSSDPEDYQKGFRDSLMYNCIEFQFNSILLYIIIPPGPEATPTTTNRRKGRLIMTIISVEDENKGKERKVQVQVDKRITLAQLKEELVPLIGVPSTGFRVYGVSGNEEYELKRLNEISINLSESKLRVKLGRAVLQEGEYRIKLYLLQVNSIEFCEFMMESIVAKNTRVREFKKQIIEEAKVQGIDCVLELDKMRLRDKRRVYPGTVYLDDELIDTSMEMYVEPLKGPEKKHNRQRQA